MTKLALYFAPGSSSMAVHIALHEVGAPFEPLPMSFNKHDMRATAFRAINPAGKVPTLLIDGSPLTEVAACLFYLAKRFPEAKLLPAGDIEAEAQAVSWMSFIASTLHPARRQGLDHLNEVWRIAEAKLANSEWALGEYSVVDIHLFRLFWRMIPAVKPAPASLPRLFRHYERMMIRPAVKRTIEIESAIGYELPA
jgi:glutathione S-transferase